MFRNREIRQFVQLFAAVTAVFTALGFVINPAAGILSVISSAVFGLMFFTFTRARYKSIARISEQIDIVLHNADELFVSELEEGELSILQSEITKMTLRIKEQNEMLKKEQKHLADSLADIAHQLRTPLTSANLMISLLKNNSDEPERKELLRETEELFIQMDWLITSLLKLSRLDAGIVVLQRELIDVDSIMKSVIRPFLISMELHNITLEIDIPNDIKISGDLKWLLEAFQNIIKNCMESIGDNGKIEILCIDTLLYTEIVFHDSGKGFDKEDISHLFERFYQGKNSGAGYGIGLALSKTIIMQNGGTVTAKNHPNGGAVFYVRFPK